MSLAETVKNFLGCIRAGGHTFVSGVCSRCGAPKGGTTLLDLVHEAARPRALCRGCWADIGKPSATFYAGNEPAYACSRCGMNWVASEIVWVDKSVV